MMDVSFSKCSLSNYLFPKNVPESAALSPEFMCKDCFATSKYYSGNTWYVKNQFEIKTIIFVLHMNRIRFNLSSMKPYTLGYYIDLQLIPTLLFNAIIQNKYIDTVSILCIHMS